MTMHELDVFNCPLDGVHLIEASAGTGKTWNLCGLYLRLLLEQQRRVEEILVVTFTKAATAELRARIRSRLAELARALEAAETNAPGAGDPFVAALLRTVIDSGRVERQDARQRLRLALESFDGAAIFTIHGFCQRALAETPFAASEPFQFEFVADDTTIRHEVAADFWRQQISRNPTLDEGFAAYIMEGGLDPEWLTAHLARRQKKPLSQLRWPDLAASASPSPAALQQAFTAARELWGQAAPAITATIVEALAEMHGASYKLAAVQTGAAAWGQYFTGGTPLAPLDDKQRLFSADYLTARTKKGCTTPSHPFFDLAATLLTLHQAALTFFARQRLQLLHDWLEQGPVELWRRKQGQRLVSYDDLLTRLHRALCGGELPWLATELRRRYPCALIDEFQDTDPLQFQIFDRIYAVGKRGPLFLIGDPKQAIYSFRGADLNTYLVARSAADAQFTLSANQRSTPGVIRALNHLFSANPAAFILPNLHYQEVAVGAKPRLPLGDRSEMPGADLQVWLLPGEGEGVLLKKEAWPAITRATAAEISRLLRPTAAGAAGPLTIGEQPLKPADIAVIVRSHAQGSAMKQALTALGIGCVELAQASIFRSAQAEEVERVLQAVMDPADPALLKAALATELLGHNALDLEAMNLREEQLTAWVQALQDYRALWLEQGFGLMWRTMLRREKAVARVLALAGGERKLTNFLHLGELIQQAAATAPGLEGLGRWLAQRRLAEESTDDTAQLRLESDENLVQILTIHKAKGLEFPICFCPFLLDGRAGGRGQGLEGLEYHEAAQGVIDFSVAEERVAAAKAQARGEEAAESARLLYVALTRAVYRCYLVAGCYGVAYKGKVSVKESGRSTLNWLVAGAGVTFPDWQAGDTPASSIAAAWQGLAARAAGTIGLQPLPAMAGIVLPPASHAGVSFAARTSHATLSESWRLGSFSALNRGSLHEAAGPDHEGGAVAATLRGEPLAMIKPDDFLRFPQGPTAGECVHRVLELTDFTNPATREEAIGRGLREHPPAAGDGSGASWALMLLNLLADLLTAPLPAGLQLSGLSPGQCLPELEFCFPTDRVTASALNRLLARHGYAQPQLAFPALQGFIKGFIDLVFCHQGQYFLLDWKSNHLGFTAADYDAEALAGAMQHHGYHLQYLLYTVALHRYLGSRLADYSYQRHFGGCLYLFVRGIRPGWQNADGSPSGVFFHRPAAACIEELDQLFVGRVSAA